METKISKGELSEALPQYQENTITWDEEESNERARILKAILIGNLGGLRAFEQFIPERFNISTCNNPAAEAVKTWDATKENLYLFGPVGCGKSHLQAMAVRPQLEANPHRGAIKKVYNICRAIRACQDARAESEIIETYSKLPVLGIDDLGVEKHTEFVIGIIYEIIDARYMNRPGGLIVTSNLSLSELAQKLGDPTRIGRDANFRSGGRGPRHLQEFPLLVGGGIGAHRANSRTSVKVRMRWHPLSFNW